MNLFIIIAISISLLCMSGSSSIFGYFLYKIIKKTHKLCDKQYNPNCSTKEEYILNNLFDLLFDSNSDTDNTINIDSFTNDYYQDRVEEREAKLAEAKQKLSEYEDALDLENSNGIFTKASLAKLIFKSIHFILMFNRPEMSDIKSKLQFTTFQEQLDSATVVEEEVMETANNAFYTITNLDYNRSVDYDYFKQFFVNKINSHASTIDECTNINGSYNMLCLSEEEYILNNLFKLWISFFDVNNTGIIDISNNEVIDKVLRLQALRRDPQQTVNLEQDIMTRKSISINAMNLIEESYGLTVSNGILTKNRIYKLIIKAVYDAALQGSFLMTILNVNQNQINTYEKFLNTTIDLIDN